jgi:hypothetical protein
MGNRNPRLMALLRTDASAATRFARSGPAAIPGTRVPQHIHYEVAAAGQGSRIFEIIFDQDPNVTAEIRKQATEPGSIYSLRRIEAGAAARPRSPRTWCSSAEPGRVSARAASRA